jgi:hypothetical protein
MDATNGLVFGLALVVTGLGITALLRWSGAVDLDPFDEGQEWDRQLVTWEYDRLTGIATGLASAAVGFLGSLAVAAAKGEIDAGISTLDVVGCYLGIVGCLAAAAVLQREARDFARRT